MAPVAPAARQTPPVVSRISETCRLLSVLDPRSDTYLVSSVSLTRTNAARRASKVRNSQHVRTIHVFMYFTPLLPSIRMYVRAS